MRARTTALTCLLTLSTVVVTAPAAAEAAPGGLGPLPVPAGTGTPAPLVSSPVTRVPGGADCATVHAHVAAYAAAGMRTPHR
jgi:hypothetical protein